MGGFVLPVAAVFAALAMLASHRVAAQCDPPRSAPVLARPAMPRVTVDSTDPFQRTVTFSNDTPVTIWPVFQSPQDSNCVSYVDEAYLPAAMASDTGAIQYMGSNLSFDDFRMRLTGFCNAFKKTVRFAWKASIEKDAAGAKECAPLVRTQQRFDECLTATLIGYRIDTTHAVDFAEMCKTCPAERSRRQGQVHRESLARGLRQPGRVQRRRGSLLEPGRREVRQAADQPGRAGSVRRPPMRRTTMLGLSVLLMVGRPRS